MVEYFANASNLTSIEDLFNYSNNVTDGLFAVFILIAIGIIGFISVGNKRGGHSVALFITFGAGVLFWMGGWIGEGIILLLFAVLVGSVMLLHLEKKREEI